MTRAERIKKLGDDIIDVLDEHDLSSIDTSVALITLLQPLIVGVKGDVVVSVPSQGKMTVRYEAFEPEKTKTSTNYQEPTGYMDS